MHRTIKSGNESKIMCKSKQQIWPDYENNEAYIIL